jgi:hypothetical protein
MLGQVVQQIAFAIHQGQSVYGVEDTIERLIAGFPDSQAAQQAKLILTRPPAEVVQQLRLPHPKSEAWIKSLQDDFASENNTDEGPQVLTFGDSAQ